MDDHQIFKFVQSSQESPPSSPIPSFDQESPPSLPFPNPTANLSGGNGSINIVGNQEEMKMDDHQILKFLQSSDQEAPPSSPIPTENLSGDDYESIDIGNQEEEEEEMMMMMRKYLKKLALWNTRNFTPILSHDQLQPIMATLGFIPLPALISISSAPPTNPNPESNSDSVPAPAPVPVLWREYYHSSVPPFHQNLGGRYGSKVVVTPCPRLPYPNIIGLHLLTYRAFLEDINFYRSIFSNIYDIFHVRAMPLQQEDRKKLWRSIYKNDVKIVHCEASFDLSAHRNEILSSIESNAGNIIHNNGVFVALDDIITQPPTQSKTRK